MCQEHIIQLIGNAKFVMVAHLCGASHMDIADVLNV
jgi:hypothetical protein